jgi:hypothetical protein
MTRDDRASDRALVTGRRDYNHVVPGCVIQGLFERRSPFCGIVSQSEAQIYDSCAGGDAGDESRGDIQRRCPGHAILTGAGFGEDAAYKQCALRANRRS